MTFDFHYLGKKKMRALRHEVYKGCCPLDGELCKYNYRCEVFENNLILIDLPKCPEGERKGENWND